jgi:hypothetical protein
MFLEARAKLSREQYDENKALYPSVDDLQENISQQIQSNKKMKNLKFKLWCKEMGDKLDERIEPSSQRDSH